VKYTELRVGYTYTFQEREIKGKLFIFLQLRRTRNVKVDDFKLLVLLFEERTGVVWCFITIFHSKKCLN
jgi:hypothetical protein